MYNLLRPYSYLPRNVLLTGLALLGILGSVISLRAEDDRLASSVWGTKWLVPTPSVQSQPQIDLDDFDAMISRIRYGGESAQKILDTYGNERIEKSDQAARLLGQRFTREKNPDKAKEWLEKAVKLKHNRDNLKALARFYLEMGDEDRWLKTMDSILDLPFDVYWFAYENNVIANHFIATDEWEKALPYKDDTTRSQEDSYLEKAAWFNGVLGHVEKGLEYADQNATHYQPEFLAIYILAFDATPSIWSKELLDKGFKNISKGDAASCARAADISLSRNDTETAVSLLEQSLAMSNDPWFGVFAALICEAQGWNDRCDRILQDTVSKYSNFTGRTTNRKRIKRFADLYIEANRTSGLNTSIIKELEELFAATKGTAFTRSFIGELFRLKGEKERAKTVFIEMINVEYGNRISEFIPYKGLRAMGEDPSQILNERRKNRKQKATQPQTQQVQK